MERQSFIDYQALARQFQTGEIVRKIEPVGGKAYASFLEGRVEAVLAGIGFVDVAFPWGTERVSPDMLVRVEKGPAVAGDFLDSYDRRKGGGTTLLARVASSYTNAVGHLYETALLMRQAGVTEMDAYMKISSRWMGGYGEGVIREAVAYAYEPAYKTAIYWKAKGRQYVPSRSELESGNIECPRCKVTMGRTVYKKRTKLYACPECLFLIKPCDLVDPSEVEEDCVEDRGLEFTNPHTSLNEWL